MKKAIGLIPTRLESKRLPGKALLELDGLPLIIHTAKRAQLSKLLKDVFVCTDSGEIINVCKKNNIKTIKTKKNFNNGTERIASVAKKFKEKIIIDIQGDEPLIKPDYIDKLVKIHTKHKFKPDIIIPSIQTNYNVDETNVRVLSSVTGRIMYLSRSKVPYQYKEFTQSISKHVSVISFDKNALIKYSKLKKSKYESIEDIELLRALENDMKVYTTKLEGESFSIDVNDDYLKAQVSIKNDPVRKLY